MSMTVHSVLNIFFRIFCGSSGKFADWHARNGIPEWNDEQGGPEHGFSEHPQPPHDHWQGVYEEGVHWFLSYWPHVLNF